ncbi:MAG TPA: ATP-binding protein [Gemmatimonadaceae bacterium]|nr:ATP-binding protein [Gemmatimonadaceae bacterium]
MRDGNRNLLVPRLRRAFLTGSVALVAIALTIVGLGAAHRATWGWVLRARTVARIARDARTLAVDRETALRGFLISGNEASLEPDVIARPLLTKKLDSLVSLTRSSVNTSERVLSMQQSLALWEQGYAAPTLARAKSGSFRPENDLAGKALFDNVRSSFDSFEKYEERIYQRLVSFDGFIEKVAYGAILLETLCLLGVLLRLRKNIVQQASDMVEQQNQLEDQAAELEAQTAELEEQTALLEEQGDEARRHSVELAEANEKLQSTIRHLEEKKLLVEGVTKEKQETLALLDVVLESAPIGFAFHDRDFRYTRINPALALMSGREPEDHFGKTPSEVYPDVGHIVEPILKKVMDTGEPVQNIPISRIRTNGTTSEHHYLVSFFPVRSPSGQTEGVGTVALDTTERRNLEDQLQQAQKMEAVGRLAGGIAHDFNNILTAIKSYGDLLVDDMARGAARVEDVNEIREAADRAANLTRQLLAFSRQQMLRPRVLDLNTLVRDLKKMLERLIGADVELTTTLAPDLGMVTADPGQIEQILLNLVVNARDAMPEGGRIDIQSANVFLDEEYARTHAATAAGPHVMLSVSDTGIGMSRETQKHLFEPFFTTKEIGKGTGLGLSTVYGIVKQSGGWIWVYSEVGSGTTFKIYLPRVDEKAELSAPVAHTNGSGGNETILLVEDEPTVREVAARVLRRSGYTVIEAVNGADALEKCEAQEGRFDLIVTDIVMPEMGGLELAKKVKATQPRAGILFTSGYTEEAVQSRSFLDPGAAFLEKPFTPAHLAQRARQVLDTRENGNGS